MLDTEKLVDELVRDEGLRLHVYNDSAGIPTIGIGRNLRDTGISREEAYHLLHNDIERTTVDLDQHLPWWKNLNEARQRVIFNMAFNMGCSVGPSGKLHGLLTFQHTLNMIQGGHFREAADEMLLSKWASQVGERATRLAAQMRDGA